MIKLEEIKEKINEYRGYLKEKYKVGSVELFGSYLKGEQDRESDIDLLVEFYETIDLFEFIDLEDFLSRILGAKVDLVMKDTLKPRIRDIILNEAVSV